MPNQNCNRVVGYVRLSSVEQAQGSALEQQIARIEKAGVDEIYQDIESGADPTRPGWRRLIEDISQGRIGSVIATRWDRLSRDKYEYECFKKIIQNFQVKVILLDQGGEQKLSTASGELSADMQVLFAAYERSMLRERVKHGFAHRRSKEVACAKPPLFYNVVNNKYVLDYEPCVCSLADRPENYYEYDENTSFEKLYKGQSKVDIAKEIINCFLQFRKYRKVLSHIHNRYTIEKVNNPNLAVGIAIFSSSEGLRNWLQNPVLRGHTAYLKVDDNRRRKDSNQWELHYNTHPEYKLITDDLYEKEIKGIIKSNARTFGQPDATFYLSNLVFCAACKLRCVLKSGNDQRHKYYGCRQSNICCENNRCVRLDKIDEAIIFQLTERANTIFQNTIEPENLRKSDRLISLEKKLNWLESAPDFALDSELISKREKLLKEIESENITNHEVGRQLLHHPQARKINFWYSLTQEQREIFYDKLVDQVFILNNKVVSLSLKV